MWHLTTSSTASRGIASLPPKPIVSDFQLCTLMPALGLVGRMPCLDLAGDEAARRARLAAIPSGHFVTGGGRGPHYGCFECIPLVREVSPDQRRLLREFPGPETPQPWRPEAVRVWERIEPGGAKS